MPESYHWEERRALPRAVFGLLVTLTDGQRWRGSMADLLQAVQVHADPDARAHLPSATDVLAAKLNSLRGAFKQFGYSYYPPTFVPTGRVTLWRMSDAEKAFNRNRRRQTLQRAGVFR